MKLIVFTKPNGAISIVRPIISINDINMTPLMSLHRAYNDLEKIIKLDNLTLDDISDIHEIDESEVPQDREFRDAWIKHVGQSFSHNLDKAKNIRLTKIRKERIPKLLELDNKINHAMDNGLDVLALRKKRQQLRDLTNPLKNLKANSIVDIKEMTLDKCLECVIAYEKD